MDNIMLHVAYDGTNYKGFQRQSRGATVQGTLESALSRLYRRDIALTGSGRTDAGAHARGQVVNYHAPQLLPVERVPHALRALLPGDVCVWRSLRVPSSFHARFNAAGKRYTYTIDTACFPQVLERLYAWHCPFNLDREAMRKAACLLEGEHDFRAFCASGSQSGGTVRTLYRVDLEEVERRKLLVIHVAGSGFLYKMVRFIAGALVRAGNSRISPGHIASALEGKRERKWEALPARGLCLEEVFYGDLPG